MATVVSSDIQHKGTYTPWLSPLFSGSHHVVLAACYSLHGLYYAQSHSNPSALASQAMGLKV